MHTDFAMSAKDFDSNSIEEKTQDSHAAAMEEGEETTEKASVDEAALQNDPATERG